MHRTMVITTDDTLLQAARDLGRQVGNTPLVPLRALAGNSKAELWAKQEWKQLSGSVKSRAAYRIIFDAIEKGDLDASKILLDATSGNTGIAYATIARELGLRVSLCLPENASKERKQILQDLGAHVIYTSKFEGTDGAQQYARELAENEPGLYFYADQYKNDNNWKAHYHTTAVELMDELPQLTHFVAGLGTTGTFTGTGRRLKRDRPEVKLIALQPDSALHGLEGWKHLETAIVPGIFDPSLADEVLLVSTEEAYEVIRTAKEKEGLLLSPSSAANIAGALKLMKRLDGGVVATILPDNADKYSEIIHQLF